MHLRPGQGRLHASYAASDGKAAIDVSDEVGEHIARVFTGLMIRELGEENFTVERMRKRDEHERPQ